MSPVRSTVVRTCPLCEATCGLELSLDDDRIVRVRGNREDVLSRGYLCPKGASLGHIEADPDRLRTPMMREHGLHRPASWDEAFAFIADRLPPIREASAQTR